MHLTVWLPSGLASSSHVCTMCMLLSASAHLCKQACCKHARSMQAAARCTSPRISKSEGGIPRSQGLSAIREGNGSCTVNTFCSKVVHVRPPHEPKRRREQISRECPGRSRE
eukprot:1684194-Alexandrium_andersonii.AAC.1